MDALHGDLARCALLDSEVLADGLERRLLSRATGAVHGRDLLGGGIVEEDEHVAADARGAWLCHVQSGS